jgi:glycerophosphoryl diester phosphodiesterase
MNRRTLKVEGHRGAITNAHENTMEAFLEADRLQIDGIEFDLWLTKDQVPIISHGKTSEGLEVMMSTVTNRIEYIFLPQITSHDLKNYVYPNSHNKIPTFEEMLVALRDSKMYLNVELKDYSSELVEQILLIIKNVKPSVKVTFSSFNLKLRLVIDQLCAKHSMPRYPFGYLVHQEADFPDLDLLAKEVIPGEDSLNIDIQFVFMNNKFARDYVARASALGLHIKAYNLMVTTELEDTPLFEALVDYGVQTFIGNRVERLMEYNKKALES